MSTLRILASAISVLITVSAATAQPAELDVNHALEAYEHNHFLDTFQTMSRLADAGHAEAARVALQMLRYGQALYGQRFSATPYQELHWTWLQRCGNECAELLQQTTIAPSGC